MIARAVGFYRRLERRFYDGPAVFNHPGQAMRGYRSPTVLLWHWLRAFAHLCFTPAGVFMFLGLGFFLMAGMLSPLMPIFMLSLAVLSVFVVDLAVGWYWRPRLVVRRHLPGAGAVGRTLELHYVLQNRGPRPCWHVTVEGLPLPRGLCSVARPAAIPLILPGETVSVRCGVRATRRGEYRLPLPLADSAFPFGLWRWGSVGTSSPPLVVFPAFTPLQSLALPPGQFYHAGGDTPMVTPGESVHFLACREYRYGDSPRRLHARSWARLNRPVVKEFSEEHKRRVAIVFDLGAPRSVARWLGPFAALMPRSTDAGFEAAIALTAAVAEALLRQGCYVDFFVPAWQPSALCGGTGEDALQQVLTHLSCLERAGDDGFGNVAGDAVYDLLGSNGTVLVTPSWDQRRAGFAAELRRHAMPLLSVSVGGGTAGSDHVRADVELPAADVLAGRIVELGRGFSDGA